ncbi:hypothetical protein F5Y16DRAFT_395861 [Xylariaceae sp. FL0255]|nr:hypothetical protein F5Y16DRAFT_395861 [Xylariaceae sp. FL0255]
MALTITATPPPARDTGATMAAPSTAQFEPAETSPASSLSAGTVPLHITDKAAVAEALRGPHPVLTHVNADTTWLLHLPYPESQCQSKAPAGRSRFNVLLDPWLSGPQSDVASWFSTQEHVVPSCVESIEALNGVLRELEGMGTDGGDGEEGEGAEGSYIDVVAISHEFTDHCHESTLRQLPRNTPVFAPDKAAKLIQSWNHFDTVIETPAFAGHGMNWKDTLNHPALPPWLGIGRIVSPGNALYYHSAIMVAFPSSMEGLYNNNNRNKGDAVIYSPHGVEASELLRLGLGTATAKLRILALLHGMHDVRLALKQLNLGGVNGVTAARGLSAKYWCATHDEVKKGKGLIAPLLRRTRWVLEDAVRREGRKSGNGGGKKKVGEREGTRDDSEFNFFELGSGDVLVLE